MGLFDGGRVFYGRGRMTLDLGPQPPANIPWSAPARAT
jgi:hypothetical protein